MARRAVVICYDVSNNRTRRRIHRILKAWKLDGQYSLCEAYLGESEATELMLQLGQLINPQSDRLLLARIPAHRPVRALGSGTADSFNQSLQQVN